MGFLFHCRSGCHKRNTNPSYGIKQNKKITALSEELERRMERSESSGQSAKSG